MRPTGGMMPAPERGRYLEAMSFRISGCNPGGLSRHAPDGPPGHPVFSRVHVLCVLAVLLFAGAGAGYGQGGLSLRVGGGWTSPRGDSAAYTSNGLTGEAAVEWELGPNLGLVLGGGYTGFGVKAARLKADQGLPAADPLDGRTRLVDLTLAPRLYLLNQDIAAFVALGGGPRWLTHHATAAGTGVASERREFAWGAMIGFGVDVAFTEGFRVGFAPTYHRVNAERRPLEYATFVFYLKL